MNPACALSLYIYLYLCSSFFRNRQMIMMVLTTTQIIKISFVTALMTPDHHLNVNLIYLMMEVISSHNRNTGLFMVLGWLEFMVVSLVYVGELVLTAA